MEKETIKEKFVKKIYRELQDYKEYILQQDKSVIYEEAYKVEVFSTLYEILLEKADSISDVILLNLVSQSSSILENLYQDWLKKEDSSYHELQEHVYSELGEKADMWNLAG